MQQRSDPVVVDIRPFGEPRGGIRHLFELAEDSSAELDSYIDDGDVLVAFREGSPIGHLQLTSSGEASEQEIKSMAVGEDVQGRGIGRALVAAAVDSAGVHGAARLVVATAAAAVGNLRFYQRQGFRMASVERDAFTEATGYPSGILIDGIELRDRVWLDRPL